MAIRRRRVVRRSRKAAPKKLSLKTVCARIRGHLKAAKEHAAMSHSVHADPVEQVNKAVSLHRKVKRAGRSCGPKTTAALNRWAAKYE
jgi:hypothetical protein